MFTLVILLSDSCLGRQMYPLFSVHCNISVCVRKKYQLQLITNIVPTAVLHKRIRWQLVPTYIGRFGGERFRKANWN
jgi:hypothetical protein